MSTPSPYLPPGGYVPPGTPPRQSGPGCWLWGFITCLVIVIIFVVLGVTGLLTFLKSKEGATLRKSFSAAVSSASKLGPCDKKMAAIREAVIRYHEHTGAYPATLQTLVPVYLPGASPLHCDLDPNPSPTHVTFQYFKPATNAAGTAPLLSFPWNYSIDAGVQKQNIQIKMILLLNGQMVNKQTQTITMNGGSTGGTTTTTTTTTMPQ